MKILLLFRILLALLLVLAPPLQMHHSTETSFANMLSIVQRSALCNAFLVNTVHWGFLISFATLRIFVGPVITAER